MSDFKIQSIDDYMLRNFGARRSAVTGGNWIKGCVDCWVCSFATDGKDITPALYMVHYYHMQTFNEDTIVVYKAIT